LNISLGIEGSFSSSLPGVQTHPICAKVLRQKQQKRRIELVRRDQLQWSVLSDLRS